MNNTPESYVCTYKQPHCQTEAPRSLFLEAYYPWNRLYLSQPWCYGDQVSFSWAYNYKSCKFGNIDQIMYNGNIWCLCLNNLLYDCTWLSDAPPCKNILHTILSVRLLMIITCLILNIIIVCAFFKRPTVRKKIPNILLFNQAASDLFNGGVYGVISVAYLFISTFTKKYYLPFYALLVTSFIISGMSSLLLYTLIAIERFSSIYFPLWHRVKMRKKHIWISVIIVWLVPIVLVGCYLPIKFLLPFAESAVFLSIVSLVVFVIVAITILFISTFIKAFPSLQSNPINSISQDRHFTLKKQFRLTALFSLMFLVFAIVNIPMAIAYSSSLWKASFLVNHIFLTLLLLTSVMNPAFTLTFKKQFRIRQSRPNPNRNIIEMRQTQRQ